MLGFSRIMAKRYSLEIAIVYSFLLATHQLIGHRISSALLLHVFPFWNQEQIRKKS